MARKRSVFRERVDTYEMVERAAEILKRAGFEVAYVSRKSEAVYYAWPGWPWKLRLAAHGQKKPNSQVPNSNQTVARLTFSDCGGGNRMCATTVGALKGVVAHAIGEYFINAACRAQEKGMMNDGTETDNGR